MSAIVLLLLLSQAHATQVELREVPCPIGGERARVHELIVQNTHGGYDSDGARYSTRGQWRAYALSTCPDSLLSLYGRDMARGLTDAQKAAVEPVLAAIRAEVDDPDALPLWERYRHAARIYRALGDDRFEVAEIYLQAAWTLRDEAVGVVEGLDGPADARNMLDVGEQELAKEHPPEQRKILLFNLARIAHRGGYLAERDRYLSALDALTGLTEAESEARRALHRAAELEPKILSQAITELELFRLEADAAPERKAQARYLLGDLYRRTGRPERALPLLEEAAKDAQLPDQLTGMASFLVAEMAE